MENIKYVKLSELKEFKYMGFVQTLWKMYDPAQKKMLTSQRYEQGYKLVHTIKTDKGVLDLSDGQLGTLLAKVFNRKEKGSSHLENAKFAVKTNGKTGLDIRYYFNFLGYDDNFIQIEEDIPVMTLDEATDEARLSVEDIPF